jgi:hypothetical protein
MIQREWAPRLAVALGYVAIALAFTWPLPLYLGSRLTGDPGGDTGVYVWNQWVFQHEASSGSNPMTTQQVLSLSQRVNLSQHNYTPFLDLLALPLIPILGVVTSFNVVLLLVNVLTAWCGYVLARLAFPCTRLEAFAAGLAFAWSPVLVARATGHFSLVAAAPLAAFWWSVIKAHRTRHTGYAALAGLAMAWAAMCDPYLAVFCLLMAALYAGSLVLLVTRREPLRHVPWVWLLDLAILTMAGLVTGLTFGRGGRLELFGLQVSVQGLYTPVLIVTVLVLTRLALLFRARLVTFPQRRWILRFAVVAAIACAGPLSPVLYGLGQAVVAGQFVSPPIFWRSSPPGVDLLAYLRPNPNHPLSRWLAGETPTGPPVVSAEFTASVSLVAVVVVGIAVIGARFRPKPTWWGLTLGFMALSLGPFVIVGGFHTLVPGPWALLRYVPVVNFARVPTRFAIVATLGLAILLAGALAAIGQRWPRRRRALGWLVLVLLVAELLPAPWRLYSAEYSPLSDIIAADPRPVRVLNLPFGVRDGTSAAPNYVARYQYEQTRHGKRLIGGYLSRVSKRRLSDMIERFPPLASIVSMSEGESLSDAEAARFIAEGPAFVEATDIGYVVINEAVVTAQLRDLAIEAFRLEAVASDGALRLYRPSELR